MRVLTPAWPETRGAWLNRCDLAATTLHDGRTLFVTAAIDNREGAAGQTLQNLNLMLGWRGVGAPVHGTPW